MTSRIIFTILVGWLIGCALHGRPAQADSSAAVAIDSVSGAPVRIDTDGSNALKVLGK